MAKHPLPLLELNAVLKNAASVWRFLRQNAGLDTIFYDKELLFGNDAELGLYQQLGIDSSGGDFADDLEAHQIPVEKFLLTFFRTLQPYVQMMSGLCAFFQRHEVKGTAKSLRIEFDFNKIGSDNLEFDLEYFRETINTFEKVHRLVHYFSLPHDAIWSLLKIFTSEYNAKPANPRILDWADRYRAGEADFRELTPPNMGIAVLDEQLQRVFSVWQGFLSACEEIGLRQGPGFAYRKPDSANNESTISGWDAMDLVWATSDYWPATFICMLYFRIEAIDKLDGKEKGQAAKVFAADLDDFLNKYIVSITEEQELLSELLDLLNLPIWERRHELYGAWILALMDEIMMTYPGYTLHTDNGRLTFAFKATQLVAIETQNGTLSLWAETRMPAKNLAGHGRKASIQPDYVFFSGSEIPPKKENGLVVVEVKQYRKPGLRNFRNALDDYANGMPSAHIFLVNYGAVPVNMALQNPERCSPIGQVRPNSDSSMTFLASLKSVLPKPPFLGSNELVLFNQADWLRLYLGYQKIYVDISSSLDSTEYRKFVSVVVKWAIEGGAVDALVAIDYTVRREWLKPVAQDVDAMLSMPFDRGTDFGSYIEDGNVLIITDDEGVQILHYTPWNDNRNIILYKEGLSPKFITETEFQNKNYI